MSMKRLNWLTRTASLFIISMLLIPMFFGGIRSVQALGIIYVDDSWVGVTLGADPDGGGPATNFGTDSFATIQEGVTAVDAGGTVYVNAGTYAEQVNIIKNLSLIGDNRTSIIQGFDNMPLVCTSELLFNHPIICVNSNSNVTISGFTIDGLNKAATNSRYIGIAFHNAAGMVSNNTIQNIRFSTPSSTQEGVGIYLYNDDTTLRSLTITGNTITNFNKNGINLTAGQSFNPLDFTISLNTITGIGQSQIIAQNGIQVRVPFGGGIISGNIMSNIAFNNTNNVQPLIGANILSLSTPVVSQNNVITNAQVGVLYHNSVDTVNGSGMIDGNQISVIKPGTVNNPGQNVYGILVTDRSMDTLSPLDPPAQGSSLTASLNNVQLALTISNNSVVYTGTLSKANTYGIEIDAGFDVNDIGVEVLNNLIGASGFGFDKGLAFFQCDELSVGCNTGKLLVSPIVSNDISGNSYGIYFLGPINATIFENFHHNRIAGNSTGIHNGSDPFISPTNNWWGCNEGSGAPGCDTTVNIFAELSTPWLKLNTTANPTTVPVGGISTLTANLKFNSDATDTSIAGFVRDGIPVAFNVKTLGSVIPLSGVTSSGTAQTTFTAPSTQGVYEVCATVDSQEVCSEVTVLPALITDFDLLESVDEITWTPVVGSFAGGFTMFLDPLEDFYYLDADNFILNRTLVDGLNSFYVDTYPAGYFAFWDGRGVNAAADPASWQGIMWKIINGDLPIFFLKVEGSETMLVDGLQYALSSGVLQNPLRIDGPYLTGAYTFTGLVDDTDGYANPVSVDINFVHYPTLSSTDLVGPYTTGVQQEFNVTLDNTNGTDLTNVMAHFRIANAVQADIASLQYWEVNSSTWLSLPLAVDGLDLVGDYGPPGTGFPMPAGYNATSLFRVTFNSARSYDVTITLSDLSPDPDVTLASLTKTAVVETPVEFNIFLPIIFK